MGTSRSNVSRMLTEAQRQGIVTITINDPCGTDTGLEQDLRAASGSSRSGSPSAPARGLVKVEDQVERAGRPRC